MSDGTELIKNLRTFGLTTMKGCCYSAYMTEFEVLLVSTYELGHQPLGLSSPAAHLVSDGFRVACLDLAVEPLDEGKIRRSSLIGISVPMHTATRLGIKTAHRIREINPTVHICFFGLYASLNESFLLKSVADSVIGGEFETPLVGLARRLTSRISDLPVGISMLESRDQLFLGRQKFLPPERSLLPPLSRYARLDDGGVLRLVGAVEASRGCAHHCTHCPITPVYEGRVRIVQEDVVLKDIGNLVGLGAEHITFCDPDFLNGINHSMRIVEKMHDRFPSLTFDMTAKIQHIVEYRDRLPGLRKAGCVFIQSAVETLNDRILRLLKKEHTREDVCEALKWTRSNGIALRPSLVSFTPWTSGEDYIELLDFVEREGLIEEVDPIQFAIRLLIPPGSALLQNPELKPFLGPLDEENLRYPWRHPDERMERLEADILRIVETGIRETEGQVAVFYKIRSRAYEALGKALPPGGPPAGVPRERRSPRLTESWFCCAEPSAEQEKGVVENEPWFLSD